MTPTTGRTHTMGALCPKVSSLVTLSCLTTVATISATRCARMATNSFKTFSILIAITSHGGGSAT